MKKLFTKKQRVEFRNRIKANKSISAFVEYKGFALCLYGEKKHLELSIFSLNLEHTNVHDVACSIRNIIKASKVPGYINYVFKNTISVYKSVLKELSPSDTVKLKQEIIKEFKNAVDALIEKELVIEAQQKLNIDIITSC